MFLVPRRALSRVARPLAPLAGLLALIAAAAGPSSDARAQSFFDQLFGLSPKPTSRPAPVSVPVPAARPSSGASRWQEGTEGRSTSEHRGGHYRTVCVRLCDGAFFPVSNSAQRSHMYGDADVCRNRCYGTEARLFYHHNTADMKEAVDLAGRSYKSLPTAFLFRKTLVSGCACKPAPWSEAELGRHRQYAIAEGRVPPAQMPGETGPSGAVVIAGNYSSNPVASSVAKAEPLDEAIEETEVDGIPVVNVPVAGPPIPRMATADVDAPALTGQSQRRERVEARTEPKPSRGEPRPEPRHTQAARAHVTQAPAWKVVKPAASAHAPAAAPPRRAATPPSTAVLFGSPGNKYVWPGDAPTRYR